METKELTKTSTADYASSGLSWKPDMARFRTEVEAARDYGSADPLTFAEMECSLDLIDADLAALRASPQDTGDMPRQLVEASDIRSELLELIRLMQPFVRE